MSLLGDIWDGIVSKVRGLIDSAVTNVKLWVNARIQDTIAGIKQVVTYVWNTVQNVYNNVSNYVTNVVNQVSQYVTNVVQNVSNFITNVTHSTSQYITNIVGASTQWVEEKLAENREWMANFAKLMDPTGFLKDPRGYIEAALNIWGLAAETTMATSFLRGLEAGLKEEEG